MVNVKVGDVVPTGKFATVYYTPELESHAACGAPSKLTTDAFKGKKVVIFAVPGAFTPSCHANHLPPYSEKYAEFKAKGVDAVYVLSVNDPFVLSGWTRVQGVADKIIPLTDLDGAWSKELGLIVDLSGAGIGLGVRTTRYALVLDDLKVKYVGVEEDPTQVTVSGADAVLAAL
ncbi:peroxiredoxin [Phanerochaete sordida]|uniref:Putative peroxiredoxin n=1 Tax=Phanerochaete sordida TaxID=48140 RepID=A0A9P3LL96_9APHY|nr:peroxiredoxin [Phanerochaete sordida]